MNRSASGRARIDKAASAAFLALAAAAFARLLFAGKIGAEGMGYVSAGLELCALFLALLMQTPSMVTASLVRGRMARGHALSAHRLMKTALFSMTGAGVVCGLLCVMLSPLLARLFFKSPLSFLAVLCAGPGVCCSGALGVARGYFQGVRYTAVAIHSYVLQAALCAAGGTAGGALAYSYGEKAAALLRDARYAAAYGAAGVTAGVSLGLLLTLLYLGAVYLMTRRSLARQWENGDEKYGEESRGALRRSFFSMLLPILLTVLFQNLVLLCDARIFFGSALENENVYADWGAFYGKALPLVQGAAFLLLLPMTGLIGALAREWGRGNLPNYRTRFGVTLRLSLYLAAPEAFFLIAAGTLWPQALFGAADGTTALLLAVTGIGVVLLHGAGAATLLLLRSDSSLLTAAAAMTAFVLQASLLLVLRSFAGMGVLAAALSWLAFFLLYLLLLAFLGQKRLCFRLRWLSDLLRIALCAAIAAAPVYLLCAPLSKAIGALPTLLIAAALYAVIYIFLSLFTGAADLYHIDRLPGGALLVKLAKVMRLR